MESTQFIKEAKALVSEITYFQAAYLSPEDEMAQGTALQKRINNAFSGLQNPSLLAADKLAETALGAGFSVDPRKVTAIEDMARRWSYDMR